MLEQRWTVQLKTFFGPTGYIKSLVIISNNFYKVVRHVRRSTYFGGGLFLFAPLRLSFIAENINYTTKKQKQKKHEN